MSIRPIDHSLKSEIYKEPILPPNIVPAAVIGATVLVGGMSVKTASAQEVSPEIYEVQPDDTLSEISEEKGVSIEEIMTSNPEIKDPDEIFAGQNIVLESTNSYTIRPNDTLFDIARRYDTDVIELARVNGISDIHKIKAGDKLTIPDKPEVIEVQPGDTLYEIVDRRLSIATDEDVILDTALEIAEANDLPIVEQGDETIVQLEIGQQIVLSTIPEEVEEPEIVEVQPNDTLFEIVEERIDPNLPEEEILETAIEVAQANDLPIKEVAEETIVHLEVGQQIDVSTISDEVIEPEVIIDSTIQTEQQPDTEIVEEVVITETVEETDIIPEQPVEQNNSETENVEPINNVQELAHQVANHPNISIPTDRVRKSIEDITDDGRTFLYDVDHDNRDEVIVLPQTMQAMLELAEKWPITITSLTTSYDHSPNSLHYSGAAIDFYAGNNTPDAFEYLHSLAGEFQINELIYGGVHLRNATNLRHGAQHSYSSGTLAQHMGHVHVSFYENTPPVDPQNQAEIDAALEFVAEVERQNQAEIDSALEFINEAEKQKQQEIDSALEYINELQRQEMLENVDLNKIESIAGIDANTIRTTIGVLLDEGFPINGALFITGNFMQESGLNTGAVGDTNLADHAYGIGQWRLDRAEGLPDNLHGQILHAIEDMKTDVQSANHGVYDILMNQNSTDAEMTEAIARWMRYHNYQRSYNGQGGENAQGSRFEYAVQLRDMLTR